MRQRDRKGTERRQFDCVIHGVYHVSDSLTVGLTDCDLSSYWGVEKYTHRKPYSHLWFMSSPLPHSPSLSFSPLYQSSLSFPHSFLSSIVQDRESERDTERERVKEREREREERMERQEEGEREGE